MCILQNNIENPLENNIGNHHRALSEKTIRLFFEL